MSNMIKKAIVFLSCIAIMSSLFTGCSTGKEKTTDNTAGENQSADNGSTSQNTQGQSSFEPVQNGILPYKGEPIVYKGYAADLGIEQNPDTPVSKAYTERVGNVKIEWQTGPWSDYNDKIKVFLSSGDLPDIVWTNDIQKNSNIYGPSGLFLDWNKYKDIMPNYQGYVADNSILEGLQTKKNERYAITDIDPIDVPLESWFYNKTLLDKYGIKVPDTIEELVDAMRAIKKADPGIIPFQSYWNVKYMKAVFANTMKVGLGVTYNISTKKWYYSPFTADSNYKELIELLSMLYKEKLLNPEIATMSKEQENAVIAGNNWAFTYMYVDSYENDICKNTNNPIEIKPMSPPSYNSEKVIALTIQHDFVPTWGYFASAKVENPELLAAYIDFVVSKEASELFNWGIEGLTYTKDSSGKKTYIKEYLAGTKSLKDVGVGDLFDVRYIQLKDRRAEYERNGPLYKEALDLNLGGLKDGTITANVCMPTPMFTDEQSQEISVNLISLETYVNESEFKFILGNKSMSEWDKFIDKAKTIGNIDKVLEIYNSAKPLEIAERVYDIE